MRSYVELRNHNITFIKKDLDTLQSTGPQRTFSHIARRKVLALVSSVFQIKCET
jgi:hypothetical protein